MTAPDEARARQFEADLTPAPMVRQMLGLLRRGMEDDPCRILDPAAGAGVFGMVAAELWPGSLRDAVEPREEESESLARHYSRHLCARLEDCWRELCGPYDLIAANPPFTRALEWVPLLRSMLSHDGVLVVLQLDDFGQRSEAGAEVFARHPPLECWRVPGAVGFRGSLTGSDQRSYAWWIWGSRRRASATWQTRNLPRLSSDQRRWTVRPGDEWRSEVRP